MLGLLLLFLLILFFTTLSLFAQETSRNQKINEMYVKGLRLIGENKHDEAITQFKEIIDKNPNFPGAYIKLVAVYKEKNELDKASQYFQELLNRTPDNPFVYYGMGLIFRDKKDFKLALEKYKKAIQLFPQNASVFRNLVDAYKKLNKLNEAEEYLNNLIKTNPNNAATFYGLGYFHQVKKNWDEGLSNFDRAIKLKNDLLDAYYMKAVIYFFTSRYKDCLQISLAGLELAEANNDLEFKCTFSGNIGLANFNLSNYDNASKYCNNALRLAREIGNKQEQAKNLGNLGVIYRDTRKYSEALKYFEQALVEAKAIGDKRRVGLFYRNIGSVYVEMDEYSKALEYYHKSLPIITEVGDEYLEGLTLWSIGVSHYSLGNYSMAFDYSKRAFEIASEIGHKWGQERYSNTMGLALWNLGKFTQALDCFEKSLIIARDIEDKFGESYCLGNIAIIFHQLGDDLKALEFYNKALKVAQDTDNKSEESRHLDNIGVTYHILGDFQKAIKYYQRAVDIVREIKNRKLEVNYLGNMGNLYYDMGNYDKAAKLLNQSLALAREIKFKSGEGNQLVNLGDLNYLLENYKTALNYYQQAFTIGNRIKESRLLWLSNTGMASAYEKQKQYQKSLNFYQAAIDELEKARSVLSTEDFKVGFLERKIDVYEKMICLLAKLHQRHLLKGYDRQAFQFAERAKARAFLDLLAEARADVSKGVDQKFKQQERNVFREISYIQTQLRDINLSEQDWEKLTADLKQVEEKQEAFKREIRRSNVKYSNLVYPEPYDLDQVQEKIVDKNTALVEFFLGEENSCVWVITREKSFLHPLPKKSEIEKDVEDYLKTISKPVSLTNPLSRHYAPGFELYNKLLAPIAGTFANKSHLIVIPDGILFYLPFETLITKKVENKEQPFYLIKNFAISTAPSSSVLYYLREGKEKSQQKKMQLLAFGDPHFGSVQEIAATRGEEQADEDSLSQDKKIDEEEITVRGLYEQRGFQFKRLPFSGTEVMEIGCLFPADKKAIYLGEDAKEEVVKNESLEKFKYIHFATHGIIEQKIPSRSGIVLSLNENSSEDGFLQVNEIFNLKLDTDLVVLSACKTGLGKLRKGEGIVGLTRAFMYAGAPSVVVSLWNINDRSTAGFMKNFYEQLIKEKNKAEALQLAKLQMLQSERKLYHHPFFWAPFILIGESN